MQFYYEIVEKMKTTGLGDYCNILKYSLYTMLVHHITSAIFRTKTFTFKLVIYQTTRMNPKNLSYVIKVSVNASKNKAAANCTYNYINACVYTL